MNNLKVTSIHPGSLVTIKADDEKLLYKVLSVVTASHSSNAFCVLTAVSNGAMQVKALRSLRFEALQHSDVYYDATGEVLSADELQKRFKLANC